MSESENAEDLLSIDEICEYDTRNMVGCDNDINCCTFPKGYVYRQALHYCVTCKEITGKEAGICYPCAVQCHAGHVLEDLYTKRNFRCDCGNSNFPPNFHCKLWEEKDDVNMKNKYNHNFSGLYCICNLTYDDKDTEEMIQCVICEDWYHLKHLSDSPSELDSLDMERFEEFICKVCMKSREYLDIYNRANINNVLRNSPDQSECGLIATASALAELSLALPGYTCGSFWSGSEWREKLCRCASCSTRMASDECGFLLDKNDSIAQYCAEGGRAEEDLVVEELCNLPYSQAIVVAEGIASLQQHLAEFFSSIDRDKSVITAEDVHSFFDKIKRRRLERFD